MHDEPHHRIQITQHILRRDPNNPHALLAKPPIPHLIAFRTVTATMRLAIHLNGQPMPRTKEIEHIMPGRMLTAKFQTGRTLAQCLPQQHFRQGHFAT